MRGQPAPVALGLGRDAARVALAGLKKTHPLLFPLNWSVAWRGWRYRTTEAGLREPWRYLTRWVPDFQWERHLLDTAYIGCSDFKVYAADFSATKFDPKELYGHESYVTGVAIIGGVAAAIALVADVAARYPDDSALQNLLKRTRHLEEGGFYVLG